MNSDRKTKKAAERKAAAFMAELAELTERYGIAIGGCESCCGAPWAVTTDKQQTFLVEYLRYCKTCKTYGPKSDHEDC